MAGFEMTKRDDGAYVCFITVDGKWVYGYIAPTFEEAITYVMEMMLCV
jgi:hypothetical protein